MSTGILVNRYELGDRLGYGGMSTVHRAVDRRLEREVAVKLLAEHLADDAQFVSRFRREALAAARLVHPNIVQVFDFGLDDSSGRHYIVMELIHGPSVAEILRDRGALPVAEALAIVAHACRGLDHAHRNGVVHRDIKPGNLLQSEDGLVKVADFGIAKTLADESSITQVGSVLGTAAYLSPEQAAGEEAGPRTDLYSLGVVTYQLLSGRLPYEAQSLTELALKQQRETPPLLDALNSEVPPQLALAVDRSLALDPRARYDSAETMHEALVDGARGVGPATTATRIAGPGTEATRIVSAGAGASETAEQPALAPVRQRVPRQPPRRYEPPPPAPAPTPPRRRGARRFFTTMLVLLALAVGAAAAVIATSQSSNAVRLRDVAGRTVNDVVDQLKGLIDDNTR